MRGLKKSYLKVIKINMPYFREDDNYIINSRHETKQRKRVLP